MIEAHKGEDELAALGEPTVGWLLGLWGFSFLELPNVSPSDERGLRPIRFFEGDHVSKLSSGLSGEFVPERGGESVDVA